MGDLFRYCRNGGDIGQIGRAKKFFRDGYVIAADRQRQLSDAGHAGTGLND